jgi:hypothetical protein
MRGTSANGAICDGPHSRLEFECRRSLVEQYLARAQRSCAYPATVARHIHAAIRCSTLRNPVPAIYYR